MRRAEFYKRVFNEVLRLSDDGFIVVDNRAIVTDINDLYSTFLGETQGGDHRTADHGCHSEQQNAGYHEESVSGGAGPA